MSPTIYLISVDPENAQIKKVTCCRCRRRWTSSF